MSSTYKVLFDKFQQKLNQYKYYIGGGITISGALWYYYHHKYIKHHPQLIYHEDDDRIKYILENCPSLYDEYDPPLWTLLPFSEWFQILASEIRNASVVVNYSKRQILTMSDGGTVRVDIADDSNYPNINEESPILILLHTLTGSSDTTRSFILYALKRGWRPIVFNRRGHDMKLTSPKFNAMGDADDTHVMLEYVHNEYPNCKFIGMAGLSAGSGQLVTYIGQEGKRRKEEKENTTVPLLGGAVSISPAYDVETAFGRIDEKFPGVSRIMVNNMKRTFIENNKDIWLKEDPVRYHKCLNTENLQDFLSEAAKFTHDNFDDWATESNPMRFFADNQIPCLVLNSEDDPVSLKENFRTTPTTNFVLAITKYGSHVAFREGWIGLWNSWMERITIDFLESCMKENNAIKNKK